MADDFQKCSDAFSIWLTRMPGVYRNPKIQLQDLRGRNAGRGIIATHDIDQDDELFIIPRHCVLTFSTSALRKKLPAEELEALDDDPWLALILTLIYEHMMADNSIWKPYLDVLPRAFDTLMFWSEHELAELQASAIKDKIGRDSAEEMFNDLLLPLIRKYPVLFSLDTSPHTNDQLLALAHRMASTIMAYAFDLEKTDAQTTFDDDGYATDQSDDLLPKGLVPLADMLNADATCNARLFYHHDSLSMRPLRLINAGEEVLNDYGPLPRSELLRRYGYSTPNYAPYDVAEVSLKFILHQLGPDQDMSDRLDYLSENDYLEDGWLLERGTDSVDAVDVNGVLRMFTDFSPNLRYVVKVLLVDERDFKRVNHFEGIDWERLEVRFLNFMHQLLTKRLAQYSTSSDDDLRLLVKSPPTGRKEMAVKVRLAEKQILAFARDYALEKMEQIANNEDAHVDPSAAPPAKRRKT